MAEKSQRTRHVAETRAQIVKGESTSPLVLSSFTPPGAPEFDDGLGTTGSRYHGAGRRTKTGQDLAFTFVTSPTYTQLKMLLALFFCGESNALPIDPAAVENAFSFQVDYNDQARVFNTSYLNTMTLEWGENSPLKFTGECIGTEEEGTTPSTWGTMDFSPQAVAADCTIGIGSDIWHPKSGNIKLSHNLTAVRNQSLYPVVAGADVFQAEGSLSLSLNADVWALISSGTTGALLTNLSVTAEAGSDTAALTIAKLCVTSGLPSLSESGEIESEVSWNGYGEALTDYTLSVA